MCIGSFDIVDSGSLIISADYLEGMHRTFTLEFDLWISTICVVNHVITGIDLGDLNHVVHKRMDSLSM